MEEEKSYNWDGDDDGCKGAVEAGEPDGIDDVGIFDRELNLRLLKYLISFFLIVLDATFLEKESEESVGKFKEGHDESN